MKYQIIPVTPFEQNCSLLWCEKTQRAALVDPGGDVSRILRTVEAKGVTLEKILVTHGHVDHAGAVAELANRLSLPIEGPQREDRFWIDGMPQQSRMFGLASARAFTPDRWLEQDDEVTFGEVTLAVLHCPGHTPGHVVFFDQRSRLAIVGDVLFQGSIGRTDLPAGPYVKLVVRECTPPAANATASNKFEAAFGGWDPSADPLTSEMIMALPPAPHKRRRAALNCSRGPPRKTFG